MGTNIKKLREARYLTLELETFLVAHPAEPNNPQLALGHND